MATTDVQLCNIALARVGHRKPISTLTASTVESEQCAVLLPHAKDVVLAAHPWAFATRRATLALHATATRSGWDNVYVAPADMVHPRYIYSGVLNPTRDDVVPFALEDDGSGTAYFILTNEDEAELVYTTNLLAIARWPALVQDAVAWQLAQDLALCLPVKPQVALAMEPKVRLALARAAAMELNKEMPVAVQDSEFVRAR